MSGPVSPRPETAPARPEKSLRNEFPGRPIDLVGYRRAFPDQWAAFLRAQFGYRPLLVAVFFDVTERTAFNWLNGAGGVPAGHFTTAAAAVFPRAYAETCGPAAKVAA
jgi:hypothetical protein